MKKTFNASALRSALGITTAQYELVKPTLELADGVSVSLAERLLKHGIGDSTTARPFAVYYIAEVRKVWHLAYEGQRGVTFGYGNKYERQVTRLLSKIFDDVQAEVPAKKGNTQADKVKALFNKWKALSASEKRRFTNMQLKAD